MSPVMFGIFKIDAQAVALHIFNTRDEALDAVTELGYSFDTHWVFPLD